MPKDKKEDKDVNIKQEPDKGFMDRVVAPQPTHAKNAEEEFKADLKAEDIADADDSLEVIHDGTKKQLPLHGVFEKLHRKNAPKELNKKLAININKLKKPELQNSVKKIWIILPIVLVVLAFLPPLLAYGNLTQLSRQSIKPVQSVSYFFYKLPGLPKNKFLILNAAAYSNSKIEAANVVTTISLDRTTEKYLQTLYGAGGFELISTGKIVRSQNSINAELANNLSDIAAFDYVLLDDVEFLRFSQFPDTGGGREIGGSDAFNDVENKWLNLGNQENNGQMLANPKLIIFTEGTLLEHISLLLGALKTDIRGTLNNMALDMESSAKLSRDLTNSYYRLDIELNKDNLDRLAETLSQGSHTNLKSKPSQTYNQGFAKIYIDKSTAHVERIEIQLEVTQLSCAINGCEIPMENLEKEAGMLAITIEFSEINEGQQISRPSSSIEFQEFVSTLEDLTQQLYNPAPEKTPETQEPELETPPATPVEAQPETTEATTNLFLFP